MGNKKEDSYPKELFTENIVRQKTYGEFQEGANKLNNFLQEQASQDRRLREKLKHDRIRSSKQDKYQHAINVIIDRLESWWKVTHRNKKREGVGLQKRKIIRW